MHTIHRSSISGWFELLRWGVMGMVLLISSHSFGAIINVPADFPTIQGAINAAAVKGDEIIVAPGTYNEVINFNGKAIHLHSASGNPVDTIIDGTGLNDSVMLCISGEGTGTILEGFTITGGNAGGGSGGGMHNFNSSPTVTNCIFSGNSAFLGGGMYNSSDSNPTISNCSFVGNNGGKIGGGMYNINSSPILTNCTFEVNSSGGGGGGLYGGNPTVTDCMFSHNSSYFGGGIGGLDSGANVTNCRFDSNSAMAAGGGMWITSGSPTVTNCIFFGNSADGVFPNPTGGGGIYTSASPNITNCTFSGNTASLDGGGILREGVGTATVTNCIFWGNIPNEMCIKDQGTLQVSFCNVQGGVPSGAVDGGGNINANPQFVNAGLRLQFGSPSIDAGINSGVPCDLADIDIDGCTIERIPLDYDGNPRFRNDPSTVTTGCGVFILGIPAIVDMGAYEYQGIPTPQVLIGDTNGNGFVNIDDLVDVLNSFGFTGCSNGDITGNGVVNIDDLVALLNSFGGCP